MCNGIAVSQTFMENIWGKIWKQTRPQIPEVELLSGIKTGNLQTVMSALDAGANPNLITHFGWTPLIMASAYSTQWKYPDNESRLLEIAKTMVDHKADINAQTPDTKQTVLMIALLNNQFRLAAWLLEKGARIDLIDEDGKTLYNYILDAAQAQQPSLKPEETQARDEVYKKLHVEIFAKLLEENFEKIAAKHYGEFQKWQQELMKKDRQDSQTKWQNLRAELGFRS